MFFYYEENHHHSTFPASTFIKEGDDENRRKTTKNPPLKVPPKSVEKSSPPTSSSVPSCAKQSLTRTSSSPDRYTVRNNTQSHAPINDDKMFDAAAVKVDCVESNRKSNDKSESGVPKDGTKYVNNALPTSRILEMRVTRGMSLPGPRFDEIGINADDINSHHSDHNLAYDNTFCGSTPASGENTISETLDLKSDETRKSTPSFPEIMDFFKSTSSEEASRSRSKTLTFEVSFKGIPVKSADL